MLYGLLLTLNVLVCAALVGVVLMQRSEGGALGSGGGPTGLITTRGAGDLLTRTTWTLFAIFLLLSLSLTLIGARERSDKSILNRLKLSNTPASAPASTTPTAPIAPIAPIGGLTPPVVTTPAAPTAPQTAPLGAPVTTPTLTAPSRPAAHTAQVPAPVAVKPVAATAPKPAAAKP
ncbi:MAG: preprotein translocase subunit SecG, partial [Proteobacteria bacterium]|nr:preprotein translocase subunit SecG [Pseudomonadota bacterium]